MNIEIPEFLLEMSKQMNEQPNRSTSHPFWQVRCKREITCCAGREDFWVIVDVKNEYHEIYNSENPDVGLFCDYMTEYYTEWVAEWEESNELVFCSANFSIDDEIYNIPDGYEELEVIPMQRIEEVVSTHLTQHDAEWFIKRKQHDYPKLYTFVESAYWSPQFKQLQDWIKELSK